MLKSLAFKIFNRLPDKLVFPPMYFQALDAIVLCRQSPEKIADFQTARLTWLLQEALTYVPYYRERYPMPEKWNEASVWDLYSRISPLDKSQIMEDPVKFVSERWRLKNLTAGTSGGSTGQGIKIYTNYCQRVVERAFFDYQWHCISGWKRYSATARIGCNGIKKSDEYPCSRLGDKLLISPYHMNERWLPEIVKEITRQKIEFFHTYPSSFEELTDYMLEHGCINHTVKGIFLASEYVSERVLTSIPKVFPNARIVFHYGLTERSNLAWGVFENDQISYLLEPAYGVSENFVHSDGRSEIMGTSLWNNLMPFIKYKTQDFGVIKGHKIEKLDGRNQEFLIARSGEKIPGFSVSIGKFTWEQVKFYQIVQYVPGKIEIHVVPKNGSLSEEFKQLILQDQIGKWGGYFDISIVEKNSISKTAGGKMRLVVSHIGKPTGMPPLRREADQGI